jgi:hypothetical protein
MNVIIVGKERKEGFHPETEDLPGYLNRGLPQADS